MISWSPFEPFSSHGSYQDLLQSDRQRAVEQGDDCKPGGQKTTERHGGASRNCHKITSIKMVVQDFPLVFFLKTWNANMNAKY